MTRAKEVKSGAQESHKGKETKLQNKGDLESWFFYSITLCVETLPGTTPGCSFVLLKRDDTVPGLMLALEAGVGCSQPLQKLRVSGTVQAFAYSGSGA